MNKKENKKDNKKKRKIDGEEIVGKTLKEFSGFAFSLFINLIIVLFVVKSFTYSFDFTYNVFNDRALNLLDKEKVIIEIKPGSSTKTVAEELHNNKLIKDKYVFMAKVKIGEYSAKIIPGKYAISPSMTYNEIIKEICGIVEVQDTEESQ